MLEENGFTILHAPHLTVVVKQELVQSIIKFGRWEKGRCEAK